MAHRRTWTRESPDADAGTHAVQAHADDTAASVRLKVRNRHRAAWDLVCVVDHDGHLVGTLTPAELLALPDEAVLGEAARREGPRVLPGTDQERTASLALHHGVVAMPVVDDAGRLVGVVGPAKLMHILRREHVEDLHRLAGIRLEDSRAREAIEAPPTRRARDRLPWLLVGLLGSVLATFVVAGFEAALQTRVAIAFFVPGIVYLADAVGTQSEAIAVRGLSLSRLPLARLLAGELRTGLLIGITLAVLVLGPIWWWFGDPDLAIAVAIALLAASTCATTIGFALPWLLARSGRDPAFGSGPIATIFQDLLSLLIYFWTVEALLF